MMIIESRTPLAQGYRLTLRHQNYLIREVIGTGGSCIAYYADREQDEHDHIIGIKSIQAIIKELYPLDLSAKITRIDNGGLFVEAKYKKVFEASKNRFESGIAEQTAFSVSDSSHSLPLPEYYMANETVYSVVVLANGQTLTACAATLSMLDKANIITSLCNAVRKLHGSGRLYLDLKPSNIFIFEKEIDETMRVALFDFDTTIYATAVDKSPILFSDGWSPYEQKNIMRDQISYTADIYSIGAVYYWLITGQKVTDGVLSLIARNRFEFLNEVVELHGSKRRQDTIAEFLSATLKRLPSKRAQRIEDLPL